MKNQILKSFVFVMFFITSLATSFAMDSNSIRILEGKEAELVDLKSSIDIIISEMNRVVSGEELQELIRLVDYFHERKDEIDELLAQTINRKTRISLDPRIIEICEKYNYFFWDKDIDGSIAVQLSLINGNDVQLVASKYSEGYAELKLSIWTFFCIVLVVIFISFILVEEAIGKLIVVAIAVVLGVGVYYLCLYV